MQPHGAYPVESETADIKVLSGIEDPALRGQLEYYATQIHEVDEFLRTLTDVLTTWEEPTVLVLYGDTSRRWRSARICWTFLRAACLKRSTSFGVTAAWGARIET